MRKDTALGGIQLDLINQDQPVYLTRLVAEDSPRQAYYQVSVFRMPGVGFVIRKESGADASKPNIESWFRHNLQQAREKQAQLINAKLKKRKGRIYTMVKTEGEDL